MLHPRWSTLARGPGWPWRHGSRAGCQQSELSDHQQAVSTARFSTADPFAFSAASPAMMNPAAVPWQPVTDTLVAGNAAPAPTALQLPPRPSALVELPSPNVPAWGVGGRPAVCLSWDLHLSEKLGPDVVRAAPSDRVSNRGSSCRNGVLPLQPDCNAMLPSPAVQEVFVLDWLCLRELDIHRSIPHAPWAQGAPKLLG